MGPVVRLMPWAGLTLTSVLILAACETNAPAMESSFTSLRTCEVKEASSIDYGIDDPEAFATSEADAIVAFRGAARPSGTDEQVSPGHWHRLDHRGEPVVRYAVEEIMPGRFVVSLVEMCAPPRLQPSR